MTLISNFLLTFVSFPSFLTFLMTKITNINEINKKNRLPEAKYIPAPGLRPLIPGKTAINLNTQKNNRVSNIKDKLFNSIEIERKTTEIILKCKERKMKKIGASKLVNKASK